MHLTCEIRTIEGTTLGVLLLRPKTFRSGKTGYHGQAKITLGSQRYQAKNGYPPSVREICQALDTPSTSTVTYHLDALQAKGLIHRDPGVTRSLRLFKADGAQTKPIGPRTEKIVRRILELGERLEDPEKGQLLVDFAGDTIKMRLTVVVPSDA